MDKVILDAELRAKLQGGLAGLDVMDEAGNVVGHYLPHDQYVSLLYVVAPPVTRQEIDDARRNYRENSGYTTAELLTHLQKLEQERNGGS
jgi:hypothetical protein